MFDLGIITRCVKDSNLHAIRDNIKCVFNKNGVTYMHYIVIDESNGRNIEAPYMFSNDVTRVFQTCGKNEEDRFNICGINDILPIVEEECEYLYVLDDDNLFMDNFPVEFKKVMGKDFIIFDMERKQNKQWEKLRNWDFTQQGLDFAHYVVKSSLANKYKFPENFKGDWLFGKALYDDGIKPYYAGVTCVYYNKLNKEY